MTARRLGRGPLEVSPIGLGCWQFSGGRSFAGAFWGALAPDTMDAIVRAALDGGVDWFDTAEIYGNGRSERALAHALAAAGRRDGDVTVATKWWPVLRTARSIGATFAQRERALDGFTVGLHQVHQPFSFSSVEAQMDAMAALVAAGRVRAVGVSNFSAAWMRRAHARLARHGIALATNQVRYSLARRTIERDGTLAAARELGVSIIAYSPLAQGLLSGRFHADPRRTARPEGGDPGRDAPGPGHRVGRRDGSDAHARRAGPARRGVAALRLSGRWRAPGVARRDVSVPGPAAAPATAPAARRTPPGPASCRRPASGSGARRRAASPARRRAATGRPAAAPACRA